ncbi:hypothetical protein HY493_03690 [Candidatus Woesearchaeota archaeon]|nr:hypothetical protein [Candidatus Woesearchaeota archaeon]
MDVMDHTIKDVMREPKQAPIPDVPPEQEPNSTILLWAIGIIVALVIGVFAIRAFYTPEPPRGEIVTYNNFEFEYKEDLWWSLWQNEDTQYILSMHYNPLQTLNISVAGRINPTFERDTIYVTFDPRPESQAYVALAAAELSLNLVRAIGVKTIPACLVNETEPCATRPIVDCDTPNVSVIVLNNVNLTTNIRLKNDCIILSGHDEELVRAVDRMVYTFYGIITSLDPKPA